MLVSLPPGVAMFVLPLLVGVIQPYRAACVQFVAYGCDTTVNDTTPVARPPFFFSAPRIAIQRVSSDKENCSTVGPGADPLGPCFTSPQDIKTQLDKVPAGFRAISLEGTTLYNVEDSRTGKDMFRDPLPDGALSPWMNDYVATVSSRFNK